MLMYKKTLNNSCVCGQKLDTRAGICYSYLNHTENTIL